MNNEKQWKKYALILFIILLVPFLYTLFKPYYKMENRSKKLNNFKGVKDEKPLGWLRVQGTNIDFPIVYYEDVDVTNPKYEMGWNQLEDRKLTKKITIASHNMLNVSGQPLINDKNHKRFEQLMGFIYTDFVKKNKYIQYTINGKDYLYKIFGISFQKDSQIDYEYSNPTKKELQNYIKRTIDNSYFKFDVNVKESDHFITLVTCTRFFGSTSDYSFVVDARMVRKNESIKNYKVTEKQNYKEIKKILEGDVKDEEI